MVEADGGIVLIFPPEASAATPAALPGGIAEYAEHPVDCAIREVREETGLAIEIISRLAEPAEGGEGPPGIYALDALPPISPERNASRRILDTSLAGPSD